MWNVMDGWSFGWGLGHMLWWWIPIVAGIVALAWLLSDASLRRGDPPAATPVDILNRRYANGEIGRIEFEQKKRDIETQAPG